MFLAELYWSDLLFTAPSTIRYSTTPAWRNFRSATAKPLALDSNLSPNSRDVEILRCCWLYHISTNPEGFSQSKRIKLYLWDLCKIWLSKRMHWSPCWPCESWCDLNGKSTVCALHRFYLETQWRCQGRDCFGLSYFYVNFHRLPSLRGCKCMAQRMAQLSRAIWKIRSWRALRCWIHHSFDRPM